MGEESSQTGGEEDGDAGQGRWNARWCRSLPLLAPAWSCGCGGVGKVKSSLSSSSCSCSRWWCSGMAMARWQESGRLRDLELGCAGGTESFAFLC
uniref:Uncharacterized protein n=1 Tax=Arundo donax TaxID=35708 RepID=A0A0A9B5I4_ARUDO